MERPASWKNRDDCLLAALLDVRGWRIFIHQLERHGLANDAIEEVDEPKAVPKHGGEMAALWAEPNSLVYRQQIFPFPSDVCEADLISHCLQGHVRGLMERSRHGEAVMMSMTPTWQSSCSTIHIFGTVQAFEKVVQLDNKLYRSHQD